MNPLLRISAGVLLGLLVLVLCGVAVSTIKLVGFVESLPSMAAFTHTMMAILSLILMYLFSKGKMSVYGLKGVKLRDLILPIFVGLVVGGVFAVGGTLLRLDLSLKFLEQFSVLQIVVLICIYASVAEELLTRGFLQSFLAPLKTKGLTVFRFHLSMPILIAALFFGLMHLSLLTEGASHQSVLFTIISAIVLGIIAGFYRERTGSILPAIVVHMSFNVWGLAARILGDGI